MKEHEFKVGDIVKIRKDSKYYGGHGYSNPADVSGKVIELLDRHPFGFSIHVKWMSLGNNTYRPEDLELVESIDARASYPQKDTIREMRDRIYALDVELKSLQEEREKLVEVLREEGLVLLEKCKEPDADMSDWRNWKVGDLIEVFGTNYIEKGIYKIMELESEEYKGDLCVKVSMGKFVQWLNTPDVRWHSRPKVC